MPFCAFAQLVTTFIFFSAWYKSRVKWNNSRNSTQKMRTWQMSKSNFSGGLLLCLALSKRPLVITSSILKQIEKTYTKWKTRLYISYKMKLRIVKDVFWINSNAFINYLLHLQLSLEPCKMGSICIMNWNIPNFDMLNIYHTMAGAEGLTKKLHLILIHYIYVLTTQWNINQVLI